VFKNLHNRGFKIVIMSNQYVLSFQFDVEQDYPPQQKKRDWISKLIEMCDQISKEAGQVIPIQIYGSLYQNYYNKVQPVMAVCMYKPDACTDTNTYLHHTCARALLLLHLISVTIAMCWNVANRNGVQLALQPDRLQQVVLCR
jgi:hypothetical protein